MEWTWSGVDLEGRRGGEGRGVDLEGRGGEWRGGYGLSTATANGKCGTVMVLVLAKSYEGVVMLTKLRDVWFGGMHGGNILSKADFVGSRL